MNCHCLLHDYDQCPNILSLVTEITTYTLSQKTFGRNITNLYGNIKRYLHIQEQTTTSGDRPQANGRAGRADRTGRTGTSGINAAGRQASVSAGI